MSRCFPYPPPGYVSNRATGDALIESIKIKRDAERIKKEKKEQKRRDEEERKREKKEKKEKKREKKKVKSIQNIEGTTNKRKRDADGLEKSVDKSWVDSKGVPPPKKNETEAEQLERSSLSEEHGLPVLTESLSYSSDGTQSRTKRIRTEQSPSMEKCTAPGKSLRFRIKHREPESAHAIDEKPSTSNKTTTPVTKIFDNRPLKDEPCLNVHIPTAVLDRKDTVTTIVKVSAHGTSSVEKPRKKPKSAYEALFGNWVPPPIHFHPVATVDDEQWMFPCKKQAGQNRLHFESLNDVSGLSCSSAWPRAHLIPEADLYILPFTVPF